MGFIKSRLFIVVPCFNEEQVLPETAKRLKQKLLSLENSGVISDSSRVLFVDDGSDDKTWEIISALHSDDRMFCGISLSRNEGHQNALVAGLFEAAKHADAIVSMDADLQDDINAIDKMIKEYQNGCDIVYGVRSNRKSDSRFKRSSAGAFYRLMNFFGAKTVCNHADFRLMSKRAVEALEQFREVNLFLRGIVPLIGFKTAVVEYERQKRFAGKSKYPLKKMVSFAVDGITSFSIKPIRFVTLLGFLILLASLGMLIYALVSYFNDAVRGWSSILISIWGIGGLILFSIGIIGEYIGKIYLESKARPRYFIEKTLIDD